MEEKGFYFVKTAGLKITKLPWPLEPKKLPPDPREFGAKPRKEKGEINDEHPLWLD